MPNMTDEQRDAKIERYMDATLDGETFTGTARSLRSIQGYKPPPRNEEIGALYRAAGKLAAMGDNYVPFAIAIAHAGGQFQSSGELLASAHEAAARVVREGYTDVIKLASPEPGRRRDAQRPFTMREILTVREVLTDAELSFSAINGVPGIGWVEAAIRESLGMRKWIRDERRV
jgi:hypothetical protein